MEDQFDDFIEVLRALEKHEVDYVLIGGVAVILHGMPRLTKDIDFFVRLTQDNILKLQDALFSIFQDDAIKEITLEELVEYSVIRYGSPKDFYIDVMVGLSEAPSIEDLEFEIIEFENITIRTATPETLYKLKRNTMRTKDQADLFFLQMLIENRQRKD